MRRPFACLVLAGGLLAGCSSSPQPVVITAPEPPLVPVAAQPAYAEAVLPMLETMFDSFVEQGVDVATPDFPEEPTGVAVRVPYGAGAEGPPYATAEEPLESVHASLTDGGSACGEFHSTGFSCEVRRWRVMVEDVEAPVGRSWGRPVLPSRLRAHNRGMKRVPCRQDRSRRSRPDPTGGDNAQRPHPLTRGSTVSF